MRKNASYPSIRDQQRGREVKTTTRQVLCDSTRTSLLCTALLLSRTRPEIIDILFKTGFADILCERTPSGTQRVPGPQALPNPNQDGCGCALRHTSGQPRHFVLARGVDVDVRSRNRNQGLVCVQYSKFPPMEAVL